MRGGRLTILSIVEGPCQGFTRRVVPTTHSALVVPGLWVEHVVAACLLREHGRGEDEMWYDILKMIGLDVFLRQHHHHFYESKCSFDILYLTTLSQQREREIRLKADDNEDCARVRLYARCIQGNKRDVPCRGLEHRCRKCLVHMACHQWRGPSADSMS